MMRLRVGAATDRGRVRELNEDVYGMRLNEGLFVVCDGMGGCTGGEVASRMALDTILRELNDPAHDGHSSNGGDAKYLSHTSRLAEAVRRSNQVIYDQAQHDRSQAGMGTTMVGAWISDHVASVAHVGDSRAYLWHRNALEPLTRDHSMDGHQNVLLRVLGRTPDVDVELNEVPVQQGDYVLLCSDGLTRMVPDEAVAKAIVDVGDPQSICNHLIDAANRNGGQDNITLVVVEVQRSWWRHASRRLTGRRRGGRDGQAHSAM
jgi:protein phosphatase